MLSPDKIVLIAAGAHEVNRAICEQAGDHSQKPWNDADEGVRRSAISGVEHVLNNPGITAEQQHDEWMRFKLADGWVYGEHKDAEAKTHPALVEFDKLSYTNRMKAVVFVSYVSTTKDFV